LELPEGLEHIGAYAFYFAGIKGFLTLPEGLKTIGESAFESCSNMGGNLYLPSTLESIGSRAFKGDYNIQYIVLESLTAPTLGEDVFAGCDYLFDIEPERTRHSSGDAAVAGVCGRAGASLPRVARAGPDCPIA